MRCGARCGTGCGRWRTTAVRAARTREGSTAQIGSRAREERTQNMKRISMTLEVSKLSGWSNADACCAESRKEGMVRCGERSAGGKGPTQGWGAQGTRGAHPEHGVHVRDAGGYTMRGELWVSRREAAGSGGARSVQGRARAAGSREGVERWRREQRAGEGSTADWGQGTGRSALGTCSAWW